MSYLGFVTKSIPFTVNGNSVNLGQMVVLPDASQLQRVVVIGKGIIDVAKERKTQSPFQQSKLLKFKKKVGTADVTQALVNTPSVYVGTVWWLWRFKNNGTWFPTR